jgi:hypothetical protein
MYIYFGFGHVMFIIRCRSRSAMIYPMYANANAKMAFLPILRTNFVFEGLLAKFQNKTLFQIVVRTGISLQNKFGFLI